jgi:hypothetical protein
LRKINKKNEELFISHFISLDYSDEVNNPPLRGRTNSLQCNEKRGDTPFVRRFNGEHNQR